ncbi:hypothetical protein PQX77_012631 [Marasmius sp. AFHP31]|nr:hypothetical protein PQX77_012631 [Marasmius sp. AFHP31]
MSFTSVLEHHSSNTGSVLLTPRKRKVPPSQDPLDPSQPASNAEIFKWVFGSEAVASCFIRDVFQMRHHTDKGTEEFYWLKRVPCRSVRLVGLVVGVQVLEKRVIYTVDDGTSVIECLHRCSPPRQSPSKSSHVRKKSANNDVFPKPRAHVGHYVRVVGKVAQFFETRQVVVDSLERCKSANEQPTHWKTVLDLHKSHYSLNKPFAIPQSAAPESAFSMPQVFQPPQTPSQASQTSSAAPSPTKSNASSIQSPRKLRHPSRLRSRDLTDITFRIYVKHYMDNYASGVDDDCTDDDRASALDVPTTPTKGRHRSSFNINDADTTPRPSRRQLIDLTTSKLPANQGCTQRGFTLSFLRRVPELSDMAKRVVRAEAKRREREARRKEKERAREQATMPATRNKSVTSQSAMPSTSKSTFSIGARQETTSSKMKRLWNKTIRQLVLDGSIVFWSGPVYSAAALGKLWRDRSMTSSLNLTTSTSLMSEGVSLFSAAGDTTSGAEREEEEDIVLSDPEPDEVAYVPLTPQFLAIEVEKTIRKIKAPTKQSILSYLKRDDVWIGVGEWNVKEALEVLQNEGRAWVDRNGVWDLVL